MPIRVKDHSKCNEWERRRRDRLNDAFKNLAELLPHYDPARIPAKIDILEKSTEFVKELRLSNSRLLSNQVETDEKCKLIKQLQDEVNRLILRVKQLTVLLKKASITIPIGPEIKSLGSKRMKWSGKLKPEDVENAAISDGTTTPSGETVPAAGKVPTILSGTVSNQTSNISSQPSNDIITNSSAINTSVASIIVPLKETNLSNTNGCDSTNSRASLPPIVITSAISPVSTSEPTKVTFTSVMTTCSSQSSPIKVITTSKPIFTTATSAPIQLPLQTFIIAPCPITGSTQALPSQNPQIVTRIANILSAPIVPKTVDGLPCFKVPIKSLLKPIPKVIKRRRRKKKNETLAPSPSTNKNASVNLGTQEVPDKDKSTKDDATSSKNVSSTASIPTSAPTDNKSKELVEPEVQAKTALVNRTDNGKDNNEEKSGEENSSIKNVVKNVLPDSGTSALITSNEVSPPSLITHVAATSTVEKEPQETKVIDISEDVEVVIKQNDTCTENTAIVEEGLKIVDHVLEEQDKSEDMPTDKETQECDNIPVLRIIEASDEENVDHDNILSTVVVESSSTETVAEKEALDDDLVQSKEVEEKDISKESTEPEKQLMEDITKTASNSNMTQTKISEITQIVSSSKTRIDETNKSVCEIPAEGSAQNKESKSKQQEDNIENITTPDLSKEKINNQKDKETMENSTLNVSHQKVATIIDKDKSCNTNAPVLADCHNLSSICDASDSYPVTITPVAPAKENEVPSSSKVMSVTLIQKQAEPQPQPLEPLTQLSEKVLHDVVSLMPSTSSSKQREESNKAGATSIPKPIMDTTETVTTDKISECIARSIDLIDANDSELMALGEHWEDSGASPKSISPTQIFLNIFPLLPRESSINEQHHSQTTHQLSQNPPTTSFQPSSKNILPFTPSSNSRSSFFIDAMLPDDHPPSSSTEITDPTITSLPSSHSPFLPLTPPQYSSLAPTSQQISSPFSLSSNYYWTPQTIPSSSNAETNFMDYRNTSNINIFSLDENQRSCVSTTTISSSLATTSTLMPVTSVKSSTVSVVSTTSSISAPILSTAAPKPKSKSSENHSTSSNKRQKIESSGKLAFVVDTNLPTFSKDKKTKTSVTTSTLTNVTWTGASTTTTSSTLHVSTFQQSSAQSVSAVPTMDSMGHSSSTPASASSQKLPYHSCSLLDALNPMDASFFRPLINALDGHDFRSLDFPGGNSLPPPPLPPLITPSSTKSLYSSHINPAPQPVQNSSINTSNYSSHHQHSLMQPNQPIQIFSSNVPLASSSRSHSEISSHGSKHQHHNKPMQHYQSVTISSQQESRPSPSSKPTKSQTSSVTNSGTEKTSRTSGRQKQHESKQGRSGKSSRTQPYVTPNSTSQATTDQKQSQKQDRNAPNVTPKVTRTHSFHTIHSHIHPSTDLSSSSSKSYDFHNIQSQSSNKISNPVKVKPSNSEKTAPITRIQAPKSTESKTQKSKEQKAQSSHSSHNVKQPSRSSQSSFSIAQQIPSHNQTSSSASLKSISSQASAKVNSANQSALPHQTNFSRPNLETEIPKPVQLIQSASSSVSQPTSQLQQSSGDSISLFPEFSTTGTNCNTSRQFTGGQSHAPQYYHHDTSSMQQQPEQPPTVSNFPIQRTQPYYFPDISSFENFPAIHHNQGQPQLPLVPQQVHHPSLSRQTVSESSNNYGQNQSHSEPHEIVSQSTKCTYPSTASNTNSNQPEFQNAHVQHQPTTRQHQNYFMHQDAYHHNQQQQPTIQHHTAPLVQPSESQRHQPQFSICQQQVPQQQSRNHAHHLHSNTSTATTSTTTSVSSGKEKQQHSTPTAVPAMTFHPHTTPQQQQPPHHQQITNHLQQNVPQPTNRTSSKTVNWMTDTGYRSNSSTSTAASKQQRQSTVGLASASNPFSVSKLVGNTSGAVPSKVHQAAGPTRNASGIANNNKNQQHLSVASHNINASTHTTSTRQNKTSRNNTSVNTSTAGTSTTHSHNQSNYCAEALIRKNPPVAAATNDWMNDFNLVSSTNQNFHGSNYTDGHHHSTSQSHTQHHQNQNTATENFPGSYTSNICGGTYHYQQAGAASSTPSSNASHFPHFDQVQPQYNMAHHRNHHHHQPQHTIQTSTSSNYDHGQQRLHNSPAHSSQSHDMQINTASQMHYPQQHQHHHHHQIHLSNQHPQTHSSSSSVTNFNLSTIFPEINDKRSTNNSGNSLGAQVQGGSTSNNNNSNAGVSGNINSTFGYQHFGSSTEGSGNMR